MWGINFAKIDFDRIVGKDDTIVHAKVRFEKIPSGSSSSGVEQLGTVCAPSTAQRYQNFSFMGKKIHVKVNGKDYHHEVEPRM